MPSRQHTLLQLTQFELTTPHTSTVDHKFSGGGSLTLSYNSSTDEVSLHPVKIPSVSITLKTTRLNFLESI